jgi:hypothetical protein
LRLTSTSHQPKLDHRFLLFPVNLDRHVELAVPVRSDLKELHSTLFLLLPLEFHPFCSELLLATDVLRDELRKSSGFGSFES